MKKMFLSVIISMFVALSYSQTKEVDKAKDFLNEYLKSRKLVDIENAYMSISDGLKLEKNQQNEYAHYYNGKIIKLYYDAKGLKSKKEFVLNAYRSLAKTIEINPSFVDRFEVLKLIQYICFDLYNEGIFLFNENQNEEAYRVYKVLIAAQELLVKNDLKIEMKNPDNQVTKLDNSDIMNNYAVFCTNSGKLEEAKNVLIQEVKTSPTPAKYVQLINLFKKLSDVNSVEVYTNEAYTKYPNDFDVLVLSINNQIDKKNIERAIAQIMIALKLNPNNNQLYLVLGQLYADKEQYQEAIDAYQTGLKMFPEDYDLNYSVGRALFNKATVIYNKHDESIKQTAISALQESKKYFLKAKSINATKVDIDKIIEDINTIK